MIDPSFEQKMTDTLDQALEVTELENYIADREDFIERSVRYAREIARISQMINLTAITSPEAMALKHVVDSLTALRVGEWPEGCRVCDVGTGGGFPGVILKIARPDIKLTFVDSVRKKLIAVQSVCNSIGVTATYRHARAETIGQEPNMRESFQVVTARALARLSVAAELCLPLVKVNGWFVAMKGPEADEELIEGKKAISVLGGRVERTLPITLPDLAGERVLIEVKKIQATPPQYPRRPGTPLKDPL